MDTGIYHACDLLESSPFYNYTLLQIPKKATVGSCKPCYNYTLLQIQKKTDIFWTQFGHSGHNRIQTTLCDVINQCMRTFPCQFFIKRTFHQLHVRIFSFPYSISCFQYQTTLFMLFFCFMKHHSILVLQDIRLVGAIIQLL